jgi:hypothetical protein
VHAIELDKILNIQREKEADESVKKNKKCIEYLKINFAVIYHYDIFVISLNYHKNGKNH